MGIKQYNKSGSLTKHIKRSRTTIMPSPVSTTLQALSTKKLYNLSDLAQVRTYNYEFPTYTQQGRFTSRQQWFENETLWTNFSTHQYFSKDHSSQTFFLPEIDLTDLAIFGGSLTDVLLENTPSDIDMAFFCDDGDAESQGKALASRVKKFVDDCIVWMKKENARILEKIEDGNTHYSKDMMYDLKSSNKLLITRYRNCYTIKIPCCMVPIQIIHCKNLDSLLDGIDLDPTRMCFYKNELLMSESCKNAIESLAFEVDTTNASKNYLERVGKYFTKGFDLIFRDLDVESLPKRMLSFGMTEMMYLPFLNIQFPKIEGNKIFGYSQPTPTSKCIELEEGNNKLNYASNNVGSLIHNNIQNLARKEFNKFTFIGEGELYNQAFNANVTITERMLTNTYYETAKTKIWSGFALNFEQIETYLPYKKADELVKIFITDFVETRKDKAKVFDSEAYSEFMEEKLKEVIAAQIKVCKELILGLSGKGSLEIQEIPDKVVSVGKEEFYGKYLEKKRQI